jgi:hypothetical protein
MAVVDVTQRANAVMKPSRSNRPWTMKAYEDRLAVHWGKQSWAFKWKRTTLRVPTEASQCKYYRLVHISNTNAKQR